MTQREIKNGADEINLNYDDQIKFTDSDMLAVYLTNYFRALYIVDAIF